MTNDGICHDGTDADAETEPVPVAESDYIIVFNIIYIIKYY